MNRLFHLLKQEIVLFLALLLALISMIWVPPSSQTLGFIDWQVLAQLFCLMAVVAGFRQCGLFEVMAQRLLSGRRRMRFVSVVLILLPFFTSMLITNDVALIAFVPFTLMALSFIGRERYVIPLVSLQTIAANLGSMVTPVGNPQNLYLYARFSLSPRDFFTALLPYAAASLLLLLLLAFLLKSETVEVHFPERATLRAPRRLALYSVLFALCLLSVFRVLPWPFLLAAVAGCMLHFSRSLFRQVDYSLLLTFVCFFVFVGNLGQIPPVRDFLTGMAGQNALLTTAAASQVISNVPAAVLFSGFTGDWRGLLVGANLGGLGTLVASLASLISFRFYLRTPGARPLRYLGVFSLLNAGFLAVLVPLAVFL
ncbi:MAG: citrate transporter [Clostridiales bacterium]|nr:MAG: citrate transporter [Clostridiales bacterium]